MRMGTLMTMTLRMKDFDKGNLGKKKKRKGKGAITPKTRRFLEKTYILAEAEVD